MEPPHTPFHVLVPLLGMLLHFKVCLENVFSYVKTQPKWHLLQEAFPDSLRESLPKIWVFTSSQSGWQDTKVGCQDILYCFVKAQPWEYARKRFKTAGLCHLIRNLSCPLCLADSTEHPTTTTITACQVSTMGMSPKGQLCLQSLMPPTSPYGMKKGQWAGPRPLLTQSRPITEE